MELSKETCVTLKEVFVGLDNTPVSGPFAEINAFAKRVDACRKEVMAYSDALYPDSDQAGVDMLRARS